MKIFNCLNCGKKHLFKGYSYANKYCDNKCQQEFQYKAYITEWKQGLHEGKCGKFQTSKYLHRYVLKKQNYKCAHCDIDNWMGKNITLELDHINGDSTNNTEENLRMLCPNCHSQTDTYKAKNTGSGRKGR